MLIKFLSGKKNVTKNVLFFFSRAPTDHSFTFTLRFLYELKHNPAGIYLLKVNNRNTRARCEIFIVNFEHISHLALVFLLLTLNK